MALGLEMRSDSQIQNDVLAELKWDARVQPNEIGVSVKNGVVTLTGSVDSYAKKWAAEEAAHRVRGVKAVANDVEVRLPGSDKRTDEDIAAVAVRALEWDALVRPGRGGTYRLVGSRRHLGGEPHRISSLIADAHEFEESGLVGAPLRW